MSFSNRIPLCALSALAVAALTGCSAYPRTAADFGNSVRHMVESQTVQPAQTDTEPPKEGDGQRLNRVLQGYRSDTPTADQLEDRGSGAATSTGTDIGASMGSGSSR